DGIRDGHVTGVQTCALPIFLTAGTFGTINASPWFNAAIAVLFVILALAMFDVVVIDFSRFSSSFRVSEASRGSFLVAFGMGAVEIGRASCRERVESWLVVVV